jgi:hypothetical protein
MPERENISDETPIADAVEQEQETTPAEPSVDPVDLPAEPPMEANPPDWREQRQEVADDDRDDYRE